MITYLFSFKSSSTTQVTSSNADCHSVCWSSVTTRLYHQKRQYSTVNKPHCPGRSNPVQSPSPTPPETMIRPVATSRSLHSGFRVDHQAHQLSANSSTSPNISTGGFRLQVLLFFAHQFMRAGRPTDGKNALCKQI